MRGCHSAYDGICQETGGRGMKALFLVTIIANFISIISNLFLTAYCIVLKLTRCAIMHGVVSAFCFLSLVICITELEDYFNGDRFGY